MSSQHLARVVSACLLASIAPANAWAGTQPVGAEFVINTYTTGDQGGYQGPAIAADAGGNFMVVWKNTEVSYGTIEGRAFDSAGTPLGVEFSVGPPGGKSGPEVASTGPGQFVVVWADYYAYVVGDPYQLGIVGRRFDSTGTPLGSAFLVNSYTTGFQGSPRVAADAAGNFVVVWYTDYLYPGLSLSGQRFDSSGSPTGGEFVVTTGDIPYIGPFERPGVGVKVAAAPTGEFMVVWETYPPDIFARVYDSAGAPVGAQFQVNAYTTGYQHYPGVAADAAGNFVVVWSGDGYGGSYYGVHGRRFTSTGTPIGGEFQARTSTGGYAVGFGVRAAADASGDFVVVWSTYTAIAGRQFTSAGVPVGAEFEVAPLGGGYYYGYWWFPDVASTGPGEFVVVWNEYDRTGEYGYEFFEIVAQRFVDRGPCTPLPKTTCRESVVNRRGVLKMKEGASDRSDRLVWRWVRGEATTLGDFGDPFNTTDYAFCVYDASGEQQPIFEVAAPAGGTCRDRPCWLELSGGRPEFNDPDTLQGGLRRLRLKPGEDRRSSVVVAAKGENLTLPVLPLTPPVTAQVQATNDMCWTATYDALIRRNETGLFRANPGS